MKSHFLIQLMKLLLIMLFLFAIGDAAKAIDRYWIGGGNANFNDGNHWSLSTGGGAITGLITWTIADKAIFDGSSGVVGTVYLNGDYTIANLTLSGSQTITFESSGGTYTLTIRTGGAIQGSPNNTLVINSNTVINTSAPLYYTSSANNMGTVTINGTLITTSYVNTNHLNVNAGGLFKTSYGVNNVDGGWWYVSNSPQLNWISLLGTVEFSGNNQSVPGLGYANLKFSGSTSGTANKLRGKVTVTNQLTITSGKIDLNTQILQFEGTALTNSGAVSGTGTIKFKANSSNTSQTMSGTGSTTATTLEQSSAYDVIMASTVTLAVKDFIFSNSGNFDNSTNKLTIGQGGDCSVSFDDGGSNFSTGTFSAAPIYNKGSGSLTLNYLTQSDSKTTRYEMPDSFENLVVGNITGLLLNKNVTVTNSIVIQSANTGGVLNLNGKTLTFQGDPATNLGTITGSSPSVLVFKRSGSQTLDINNSISTFMDQLVIDNTGLNVIGSGTEGLVANKVIFNNSGGITNTLSTTGVGSGGSAIVEFNNLYGGSCSNFRVAPVFNIVNSGSSGLTVNYKTEAAGRTIGVEMPATAANIYISNINGIVNDGAYALSGTLAIAAGYLQINSGKSLTAGGATTITPAEGLRIKSDVSGTGSFISNGTVGGDGTAYIERYITGGYVTGEIEKYHQVSVPLQGAENGGGYYVSGIWLNSYLFSYIESDDSWFNWNWGTGNYCPTNKGYLIFHKDWGGASSQPDTTYTMTGKLNTGSYSVPVTKTGNGFSLIPNPYPSSINWNATSGWNLSNMSGSIWIYNSAIQNYGIATRNIPPDGSIVAGTLGTSTLVQVGQAFFVKASGGAPSISMNDNVRVHNVTQNFIKNTEAISKSLKLAIAGNSAADEIMVNFYFDATAGYDPQYDAEKLNGPETSPQLSAIENTSEQFSITGLPLSTNITVVPLNLSMNYTGTLTFTASQMESFDQATSIKLEDRQIAQLVDLRTNPVYTFNHTPQDAKDRFALHFGSVLGIGDHNPLLSKIIVSGNDIYLNYPATAGSGLLAAVYDIQGRVLRQIHLNSTGHDHICIQTPGVYIIKLWLPTGLETNKIIVLKEFL